MTQTPVSGSCPATLPSFNYSKRDMGRVLWHGNPCQNPALPFSQVLNPSKKDTGHVLWHGHPCQPPTFPFVLFSLPVGLTWAVSCDTGTRVSPLPGLLSCFLHDTARVRWHGRPCQASWSIFSGILSVHNSSALTCPVLFFWKWKQMMYGWRYQSLRKLTSLGEKSGASSSCSRCNIMID